jgi:hypothetical protein
MMRAISNSLCFLVLLLSVHSAQANVVTRYTDGEATANNQSEAIVLALADAAGRAFGFTIQAQISASTEEISITNSTQQIDNYLQSLNRNIVKTIDVPNNSPITGYTVNDISAERDNRWRAQVTIEYVWFEPLGAEDERRTLVVLSSSDNLSRKVQEAVEKGLVAERRFNVLERQLKNLFESEKQFIQSDNAANSEIARLSRAVGSDYMVSIQLSGGSIKEREAKYIEASKESYYVSSVEFDYQIKVIEFASREIKLVLQDRHRSTAREVNGEGGVSNLLNHFGTEIAQQITSVIFPMRVSMQQGALIVNRGIGVLTQYQQLNIYQLGETLIDPDNNESLDSFEQSIGIAQVVSIKPKYAVIEMVNDEDLSADQNYVARVVSKQQRDASLRKMDAQKRESAKKKKSIFLN